jgi:hypothetical protein
MSVPHLDDDLRVLLHSPALTLEPPDTLSDDVRRRARRHRAGTRIAAGGVTTALVVAGILVGPSLRGSVEDLRTHHGQPAGIKPDPRFPTATSDVVTLHSINKASVLTWWQGSDWCTVTTRVTHGFACFGPVNPAHQGFSRVLPSGSASITVDREHVVAGLVPPGAARIGVHMKDGREYEATIVSGTGFLVPVWSVRVDDSAFPVEYYVAYDGTGREFARQPA